MAIRQFDANKLEEAAKCFLNSAGTPYGQSVAMDTDVYHEVLALVKAVLRRDHVALEGSWPKSDS